MTTGSPEGAGGAHVQPDLPVSDVPSTTARSFADPPPAPAPAVEPSLTPAAAARARITAAQLAQWAAVYGTERRQLRRWFNIGVAEKDPCPLDDPHEMPAWWARRMKHRPPEKILAAAASAPPREGSDGQPENENPKSEGGAPESSLENAFDLGKGDMRDGEAVQQARQIAGATFSQIRKAAALGDLNAVQLWRRDWERAVETLRKQQAAERDWNVQMRLWLPRVDVEADVAELLTMFRSMREQMEQHVKADLRAEFPALDEAVVEFVGVTILTVRVREDDIFRDLPCLRLPDVSQNVAA